MHVDAPQHQQHRHHQYHEHPSKLRPASPSPSRRAPRCALWRSFRSTPPLRPPPNGLFDGHPVPWPFLRRDHQEAPPNEPSASSGSEVRTAERRRAEALRGFSSISRVEGLLTTPLRKMGCAPHAQTGSSGRQTHSPVRSWIKRFTTRSSPEWNVIATSRPPGARSLSTAPRARSRPPISSLMYTRTAWKTLFAGLPPLSFQPTAERTACESSRVVPSGRLRTISPATRRASARGTSPYRTSPSTILAAWAVFNKSAADSPRPGSIRISSGPSWT